MGDMKTPDFDDLLAAFDIPDATSLDAKEAIQETQDEVESHLKHSELCMDTTVSVPHSLTTSDAPAVSVIVKNTNCQDSYEPLMDKENSQLGHLLQNGFKNSSSIETLNLISHNSYAMLDTSTLNGDCSSIFLEKNPVGCKTVLPLTKSVQDLSPVSSPESEEIQNNGVNEHPDHRDSYFPNNTLCMTVDSCMSDNHEKSQADSMTDKRRKKDPGCEIVNEPCSVAILHRNGGSECCKEDHVEKKCDPLAINDWINDAETSAYPTPETNPSSPRTCVKAETTNLSSCLNALVALNTKKVVSEQTYSRESSVACTETMKVSSKVPISPRSPRSPLEVKRLTKQPDSPMSICSDSSGKASPALVAVSPPAIPRVRIKTIKTTSGQIKRTVTSIFPDSETEDFQSPFGSSPSQSSVEDVFSKTLPASHCHDIVSEVIFDSVNQNSSKMPLSVYTSESAESVKSLKKSQPLNSSHGLKITHNANKQRKVSSSSVGCSNNPNNIPKALHLANLNLVPHSVAASVTARSSAHRPEHSQLSSPNVCSSVPLVHQVQKTSPDTHAIMPNTAAGTLNRLLNYSNPVPTYVPNLSPPPDSGIKLPAHGYCCQECGDSFGLEKSLAFHYSRRSVHIEVTCTHCSKTLVFFNRCALLAHARDHKNKGMMMQCSQLFMKPITVNQMLVPTKPEQSVSQMIQGRSTVHSSKNQAAMPLYPDKIVRYGLKCLECNMQMSDRSALAGHYQRSSTESEGLICEVCRMLLPNKCSYRAHQRIHTHKSPFCCPECGALSRSVDFQKHVKENCLHYARKIGYSCLHCKKLFTSLPLLKSHIEEKHCEVFYKCTICPIAFKSSDGCLTHVNSKHGGSEPSYQLIHKCSCETVFKKKQLLYQHVQQHTCIFRCPECTSFFMQKIALVEHFKVVHGDVFKGEKQRFTKAESVSKNLNRVSGNQQTKLTKPSTVAGRDAKDCSALLKTSSMKKVGWTCGECILWLPDRETYISHMKKNHGKSLKRNPCRLCERSFNSSISLRRHIRVIHDGKKNVYTCKYCTNERVIFNQLYLLTNHLSLMHGIKNPDLSQMDKLVAQETSKFMGQGPKRAARDSRGTGDGGTSDTTPAKRLKPIFRCAKCGLTTENPQQFQKHIPQHKTSADTPQCQHCGLCFTSQLALSRHLYIVHKVKEPEEKKFNKEESSDLEGTGMLERKETSVTQQSETSLPSQEKISLCSEEAYELQTETCSKTLAVESQDNALRVQASGTN